MRYKIYYQTFQEKTIIFEVSSYESKEGQIIFKDEITGKIKYLPVARCEIEEVKL